MMNKENDDGLKKIVNIIKSSVVSQLDSNEMAKSIRKHISLEDERKSIASRLRAENNILRDEEE